MLVVKLWRHLKHGHSPGGRFFILSAKTIKRYIAIGRKTKLRPMKPNAVPCPICCNPFSQLRKHLTLAHKLGKTDRSKVLALAKNEKKENIEDDNALYEKFLSHLHNRASGNSTNVENEVGKFFLCNSPFYHRGKSYWRLARPYYMIAKFNMYCFFCRYPSAA